MSDDKICWVATFQLYLENEMINPIHVVPNLDCASVVLSHFKCSVVVKFVQTLETSLHHTQIIRSTKKNICTSMTFLHSTVESKRYSFLKVVQKRFNEMFLSNTTFAIDLHVPLPSVLPNVQDNTQLLCYCSKILVNFFQLFSIYWDSLYGLRKYLSHHLGKNIRPMFLRMEKRSPENVAMVFQ